MRSFRETVACQEDGRSTNQGSKKKAESVERSLVMTIFRWLKRLQSHNFWRSVLNENKMASQLEDIERYLD